MRSVQQEMARWRFESLKSRCVLIDRENLLTEHKISFKPMQAMEFNIKEAELKAALPRIVSVTPKSPSPSAQLTSRRTTLIAAPETSSTSLPNPTEIIVLDTPMKPAIKKEGVEPLDHAAKPAIKGTPVKVKREATESGIEPWSNGTPIKTIMGVRIKREVNLNIDQKAQLSIKKELETPEAIPMSQMMGTPVEAKCSLKQLQNDEATSPKDMNQNETEEDDVKTTETPAKPTMKGTKVKSNEELLGSREYHLETPAKPQRKGTPVKLIKIDTETLDSDEESFKETTTKADGKEGVEILDNPTPQKPLRKGTPVRIVAIKDTTNNNVRSILTKKRQVF
uniref:Uncharacterized protein LOC108053028 n=1 Tax=Drosophila rhopaloa TaxID=1041015 RepID=A0A6P4G0U9_DRORH